MPGVAWASRVVKRSSKLSTGRSESSAERLHEGFRLLRLSPVLTTQRHRKADDDPLDLLRSGQLETRARPGPDDARSTTSSGLAIVPVGSETATPVRAEP